MCDMVVFFGVEYWEVFVEMGGDVVCGEYGGCCCVM